MESESNIYAFISIPLYSSIQMSRKGPTCSNLQKMAHPWAKKWTTLRPMYHPGIEVSNSTLQCKFPPFGAKSVHPSVNLPIGFWAQGWDKKNFLRLGPLLERKFHGKE